MDALAPRYLHTVDPRAQVPTAEGAGLLAVEGPTDVLLQGPVGGEDVLGIVMTLDRSSTLLREGGRGTLEVVQETRIGPLGKHVGVDGELVPADETIVEAPVGGEVLLTYGEVIGGVVVHESRMGVLPSREVIHQGGLANGGITDEEKVRRLGGSPSGRI